MNRGSDTIVAVSTGVGGAIAVIRLSGAQAIEICDSVFKPQSGHPLSQSKGYTIHYGDIFDSSSDGDQIIDDILVSLFRAPRSYTGEDMVEISCHGSSYIKTEIVKLLIRHGARHAEAGEFTVRAFLAGKLDLSQAEAVADMIASTDRASHALASNQLRGGYSSDLFELREELISLVSLLELELDFSEEDVEFADRCELRSLIIKLADRVKSLLSTFDLGNAIKDGVAVAIVGSPNVGKSTLLNALLREDRAMVSEIAGTTRDVIEESVNIGGVKFRFIDTAGIRSTEDTLEIMGIERTFSSIARADIVVYTVDARDVITNPKDASLAISDLAINPSQVVVVVANKVDLISEEQLKELLALEFIGASPLFAISARNHQNIDSIVEFLSGFVDTSSVYGGETIVSNSRHYEALLCTHKALSRSLSALSSGFSSDLLCEDLRDALHHLGTITGEITTDDILSSIFSKFCIGK